MSNEMLKPCPFCGATRANIEPHLARWVAATWFRVSCETCHAETKECATTAEAVGLWNRRAPLKEVKS
jgi:Lar family restriction alleviation protein